MLCLRKMSYSSYLQPLLLVLMISFPSLCLCVFASYAANLYSMFSLSIGYFRFYIRCFCFVLFCFNAVLFFGVYFRCGLGGLSGLAWVEEYVRFLLHACFADLVVIVVVLRRFFKYHRHRHHEYYPNHQLLSARVCGDPPPPSPSCLRAICKRSDVGQL